MLRPYCFDTWTNGSREGDDQSLWLWGNDWISNLQWDPKEWTWRRQGILPDTTILNYTTKRGYRIALQQNGQQMKVDAELEEAGLTSKARARFFNRIWHPHLPRKVSAMQWLVLIEGLPVGAWRERIGLSSACLLCPEQSHETLQHAFQQCPAVVRVWNLFRNTRRAAGLPPSYLSWKDVSRGLMTKPAGISAENDLRWDTASTFIINSETPWDILRAQLLWSIWCQKVAHAFSEEEFHLGIVLWHAWRNTIYCAMEAFKELNRQKRNEEKKQELLNCFLKIWTSANIFGRANGSEIRWNVTPHPEFLPKDLGAWTVPPNRIHRLSPSPDPEAEFAASTTFADRLQDFLQAVGNNWRPLSPDQVSQGSPRVSESQQEPDNSHSFQQQTDSQSVDCAHTQQEATVADEAGPSNRDSNNFPCIVQEQSVDAGSRSQAEIQNSPDSQWRDGAAPISPHGFMGTHPLHQNTAHKGKDNLLFADRVSQHKIRSRPKKRCPRSLGHPSRHNRERPSLVCSNVEDLKGKEPLQDIHEAWVQSSIIENTRITPKSRPKRRCHFGPQSRLRRAKQRSQQEAECNEFIVTLGTLPTDPEPAIYFCQRSGLPEEAFDDQSAQDINVLLKEIDTNRRFDLEIPVDAKVRSKASCLGDPFELNDDPDFSKKQINAPGACSSSSPNLDIWSYAEVVVPISSKLGLHKSRPKVKCLRGPFAGRGRSKVKNPHPPPRVRPPSPPIIRSL